MNIKYLVFLISLMVCSPSVAQEIRPIRDSIGFCWDSGEMDILMDYLVNNNPEMKEDSGNLFAAISVHDDYLYAGNVYYPLYKNIKTKEVIIFGVTHGTVKKELGALSNILILDEFSKWRGPYKYVEVSPLREFIKSKLPNDDYIVSNKAHSIEHSIEALIPFLQYFNRDIKITPVMVTQMELSKMEEISSSLSRIISEYARSNKLELGKDLFILISNDANHYGEDFNNAPYGMDEAAHKTATENDRRIISGDLEGEITIEKISNAAEELLTGAPERAVPLWCGRYPILFGLQTVLKIAEISGYKVNGRLFRYSDTFTEKVLPVKNTSMGLTAVFSYRHWCGWFTEGFYLSGKK